MLHSILGRYQGANLTCDKMCDALVLGSLTKAMKSIQVLIPPDFPYSNISFNDLAKRVREMDVYTHDLCSKNRSGGGYGHSRYSLPPSFGGCPKQVMDEIESLIKSLEKGLCGLDLMDFKGKIQ